jgi:Zn-dependent protease with chaperone function
VTETTIKKHSSDRHHQVAAIGHRIVAAGRVYVERKLQEAVQAAAAKLGPSATLEQQKEAAERDETVQDWLQAQLRLDGEPIVNNSTKKNIALPNPHPWQYIFLKSPAPNAFVTEILPQRFFITTAMLDVATTPDEVAVVLGHEISHLILGHVSETNSIETFLRTLEVLLLSMDPTAGLVSVAIMGLLYAARQALSAAYSREHERQADELGLELAALACFDTQKGSHVMYKMHQATTSGSTAQSSCLSTATNDTTSTKTTSSSKDTVTATVAGLLDSHPPTLARWEQMERTAREGENYTKHDHCASISSRFLHALWGKSNKVKEDSTNAASK